jgi:hypothetical protein
MLVIEAHPIFKRIQYVVLDPTVVRDDQAFRPWFVVVSVSPSLPFCSSLQQANKAIIVASTKRPAYACKNLQVVQVNPIRMLSSLIKIQCCTGDGCVQSASFGIWLRDGYEMRQFFVEAHWYEYFPVY